MILAKPLPPTIVFRKVITAPPVALMPAAELMVMIDAFRRVDIVSELVEKLPNGEFRNELDMDIILFGRSYRGKQVGPYARLLCHQQLDDAAADEPRGPGDEHPHACSSHGWIRGSRSR